MPLITESPKSFSLESQIVRPIPTILVFVISNHILDICRYLNFRKRDLWEEKIGMYLSTALKYWTKISGGTEWVQC